jgi:hypothetical protein
MDLITGDIVELSLQGITILIPQKISSSIEKGTKIENCSIKIGGRIITVDCIVERNNYYITLFFDNLDDDDSDFLEEYFEKKAERELMHKKK